MTETEPQFLDVGPPGAVRRIAFRHAPAADPLRPGLFWMSGLKSDMASTKAVAMAEHAARLGLSVTRFDYSGHGLSEGRFEEGTISRWLEESEAVFEAVSRGPQIVIGSSMGGYLALLMLRRFVLNRPDVAARILGLVLIAPAWDMTEALMWAAFPPEARRQIMESGVYPRPSAYGEPYLITRGLIEDGRRHLLADAPFEPGRPVLVLQGGADVDVPAAHVRKLPALLKGNRVAITEIADGEHRLSRPQDLAMLYDLIGRLLPPTVTR